MRNEGIAITTKISTGTTVQTTSTNVWWVVRDGTGLRASRNRTMAKTSRPSTKTLITVMMTTSKVWNAYKRSMTGVAGAWKLICQGCGICAKAGVDTAIISAARPTLAVKNR